MSQQRRIEYNLHRQALSNGPEVSEFRRAESIRAGQVERQAVAAAEQTATQRRKAELAKTLDALVEQGKITVAIDSRGRKVYTIPERAK